jgi:hypothetical protein
VLSNVIKPVIGAIAKGAEWVKDKLFGKKKDEDGGEPSANRDAGLAEATTLLQDENLTTEQVSAKLPAIKDRYGLSELKVVTEGSDGDVETDHIVAAASPAKAGPPVRKPRKAVNVSEMVAALWDEVVERLAPGRGEKITRLSDSAAARCWTVLSELAGRAPFKEGIAGALADVRERIDEASAKAPGALDAKRIYALLVGAARAVKDLYPSGALEVQIHHEQRVGQNPATFLKDRAQRVKPRVQSQLEKELGTTKVPRKEFEELVRSRLRDKLMDEIFTQTEGTQGKDAELLDEIDMTPMTTGPHGLVHAEERDEERRKRQREADEARGMMPL